MKRMGLAVAGAIPLVLVATSAAFGAWSAAGSGSATAKTAAMPTGGTPTKPVATATTSVGTVLVEWPVANYVGVSPATAVDGYLVKRYKSGVLDASGPAAGCAGTRTGLTCSDSVTVSGAYTYKITPVSGASSLWTGAEGPASATYNYAAALDVTSVTPNVRGQGAAATTMTITGTGFVSGATAAISGTGATLGTVTFVSTTQLTATLTMAATPAVGARNVTVTNPSGAGSDTCTGCFTVNVKPTVNNPANTNIPRNTPAGTTFNLTGTGFVSGFVAMPVDANYTVVSSSFTSSTSITVTIRNNYTDSANHNSALTITNPDGGFVTSNQFIRNPN